MPIPRSSLEQWAVLAAVIDRGGFSQAAQYLNRSQSAVSYAVAHLAEALGVPLLEIRGRKAVLTADGATLLRRARQLLAEAAQIEKLAQSLKRGVEARLRLVIDAAYPQARLLGVLAAIKLACPNTELELADAVLSGAEEAISAARADVVVTSRVPPGHLGDPLLEVEFVAVAHPGHALFALGRAVAHEDLLRHTQVVIRDSGTIAPRDDGWLGSPQRWTVSSMEACVAAVEAGLAYAWLPSHLIGTAEAAGRLRRLPLVAGASRRVPLYVVLVQPELAGPAARQAVELLRSHSIGTL
jgi:DNA-binding transcriptional LysR family regulator